MFRYLPLILKNCWRNRRRTILTVISIGVSMCLLGVMITMYTAFYLSNPTPEEATRLVVRNRISLTQPMPQSYQAALRQMPGVTEVMIANWFGGTYKDARDPKNQFARFAVEPEKIFKVYGEFQIPEGERKAFEHDRAGCVIGRDLARIHNLKVGDKIPLTGDIYPGQYEFTVRGIFDYKGNSQIMYFNKEYIEQTMPERRRGQVGMYYVKLDDPAKSGAIAKAIDEQYRNSPTQTKTEDEHAFAVGFLSLLGNVKLFLAAISAAVMFTILLVSANTMAMSVRERVREIGVLKTLGFTSGSVLGLVLGEACAISLVGGAIGYGISTFLMQLVVKSPFGGFLPPLPVVDPRGVITCLIVAASIGLISSLIPALGASRLSIVAALRSTD
ncbi:MAG TPA: FtsX-like permease family protein [Candidatus Solibacter sp.]|nr:FtsX-like permease family protein [Candidatus Solibacter sp.]